MKYIPIVAGILLGLLFIASSVPFFLGKMPPPPPEMTPATLKVMEAFGTTGYMHFVKVFELIGGILVAIPLTRNLGLLILGPIIVNILFVNAFIMKGVGVMYPMVAIIVVIPLYLLWVERRAFSGLIFRNALSA